jgi:hypothetical protein
LAKDPNIKSHQAIHRHLEIVEGKGHILHFQCPESIRPDPDLRHMVNGNARKTKATCSVSHHGSWLLLMVFRKSDFNSSLGNGSTTFVDNFSGEKMARVSGFDFRSYCGS